MANFVFKAGWIPDVPDVRDKPFKFMPRPEMMLELPDKIDLRPQMPEEIYDQGQLGSCTAQAGEAVWRHCKIKQYGADKDFLGSRLFLYYNTRLMMGTVSLDSGAFLRDTFKVINKLGLPEENRFWPYVIDKFDDKPSNAAYVEAEKHQAIKYSRVDQLQTFLKARLAMGWPVAFGFSVYESFGSEEVIKTGRVPMPKSWEKSLGGHAVVLVGYDDADRHFIVRNSYGVEFGDKGHIYLPYIYVCDEDMANDFWTITEVE